MRQIKPTSGPSCPHIVCGLPLRSLKGICDQQNKISHSLMQSLALQSRHASSTVVTFQLAAIILAVIVVAVIIVAVNGIEVIAIEILTIVIIKVSLSSVLPFSEVRFSSHPCRIMLQQFRCRHSAVDIRIFFLLALCLITPTLVHQQREPGLG